MADIAVLASDLRGMLRSEFAGSQVEVFSCQVIDGRVISFEILLPGRKFTTKVPASIVQVANGSVTCHAPSRVTVTNHVTKRPLKRVLRMPL